MPFTPSILEEKASFFLENPKSIASPYMTIGFETIKKNRHLIEACLHMGDHSARPQFVSKKLNEDDTYLTPEKSGQPFIKKRSRGTHQHYISSIKYPPTH